MPDVSIRPATAHDIGVIVELANELDAEEGGERPFTVDKVRRYGFGARPMFAVFLAERGGRPVGYALICDAFNSERAAPSVWMEDLYVRPEARRLGVAKRLMAAVAAEALARGAESVWWGVRIVNTQALAFYDAIGAHDDGARILELNGRAVERLAAMPV